VVASNSSFFSPYRPPFPAQRDLSFFLEITVHDHSFLPFAHFATSWPSLIWSGNAVFFPAALLVLSGRIYLTLFPLPTPPAFPAQFFLLLFRASFFRASLLSISLRKVNSANLVQASGAPFRPHDFSFPSAPFVICFPFPVSYPASCLSARLFAIHRMEI